MSMSNLIGIDYGTKRIGLAFADTNTRIATPLQTINNDDTAVAQIVDLCGERDVELVILGESKKHSGEDNPIMKQIRSFKQVLEERADVPVVFVPEFYTSAQARRQPEADHNNVDGSAAAIILQSYLNDKPHEDSN